jgi:hypothetical protein
MILRLRTAFGVAGLLVIDLATLLMTAAMSSTGARSSEPVRELWTERGFN